MTSMLARPSQLEMPISQSNTSLLPTELWISIFEYLDLHSVVRLSMASTCLRVVSSSPSIWRRLCKEQDMDLINKPYQSLALHTQTRRKWLNSSLKCQIQLHEPTVSCIAFSENGTMYSGGSDGALKCLNSKKRLQWSLDLKGFLILIIAGRITALAVNKAYIIIGHKAAPYATLIDIKTFMRLPLRIPSGVSCVSLDENNWMVSTSCTIHTKAFQLEFPDTENTVFAGFVGGISNLIQIIFLSCLDLVRSKRYLVTQQYLKWNHPMDL